MIHHEGTEARKKLKPTDLLIVGENTEFAQRDGFNCDLEWSLCIQNVKGEVSHL